MDSPARHGVPRRRGVHCVRIGLCGALDAHEKEPNGNRQALLVSIELDCNAAV